MSQLGHYQIQQLLGVGGMGEVYRGIDLNLDRPVAIKMIAPELALNEELMTRFRNEAVAQARLNHPHIVSVFSLETSEAKSFLVLEYCDGCTLADLMKTTVSELDVGLSARILTQVLDALEYAHRRGVVHRDIKPANVMMTTEGDAKVMDFGIARLVDEAGLTSTGTVLGTVWYMSPEQILAGEVDHRTDIYSAGVILYEILTGTVPYDSSTGSDFEIKKGHVETEIPSIAKSDTALPDDLDDIVRRALAKDPEQRFASAEEFKRVLAPFVSDEALDDLRDMISSLVDSDEELASHGEGAASGEAAATVLQNARESGTTPTHGSQAIVAHGSSADLVPSAGAGRSATGDQGAALTVLEDSQQVIGAAGQPPLFGQKRTGRLVVTGASALVLLIAIAGFWLLSSPDDGLVEGDAAAGLASEEVGPDASGLTKDTSTAGEGRRAPAAGTDEVVDGGTRTDSGEGAPPNAGLTRHEGDLPAGAGTLSSDAATRPAGGAPLPEEALPAGAKSENRSGPVPAPARSSPRPPPPEPEAPTLEERIAEASASARAASLAGDHRAALRQYTEWLRLSPEDQDPLAGIALAHLRLGNTGDGESVVLELEGQDPDHDELGQLFKLLSDQLYQGSQYSRAFSYTEKALERGEAPREMHRRLGNLYFEGHASDPDGVNALRHYRAYRELGGSDSAVLNRMPELEALVEDRRRGILKRTEVFHHHFMRADAGELLVKETGVEFVSSSDPDHSADIPYADLFVARRSSEVFTVRNGRQLENVRVPCIRLEFFRIEDGERKEETYNLALRDPGAEEEMAQILEMVRERIQ